MREGCLCRLVSFGVAVLASFSVGDGARSGERECGGMIAPMIRVMSVFGDSGKTSEYKKPVYPTMSPSFAHDAHAMKDAAFVHTKTEY